MCGAMVCWCMRYGHLGRSPFISCHHQRYTAYVYTAACVQQNMPAVCEHNYMHMTELFVVLFAGVTSIPWAQAPWGYFIPQLYSMCTKQMLLPCAFVTVYYYVGTLDGKNVWTLFNTWESVVHSFKEYMYLVVIFKKQTVYYRRVQNWRTP